MYAIARTVTVLVLLLTAACITVNVYFPEAAAENAADRIIREVYGQKPSESATPAPVESDEQSFRERRIDNRIPALFAALFDTLIPTAHAADPDIDISTPAIGALKENMKKRHQLFVSFYNSGAIGMDNRGLLSMRSSQLIPIRERNTVKQLIVAENHDRNALYQEIAKANGHKDWEDDIRSIFARRWVGNAPYGWWFQDQSGEWKQK